MAASRRLAAVMFTDLVDFTSLSQRDEGGTLAVLGEHRAIVRPLLAEFDGREVKTTGDGFLVEFDSALQAVLCAVAIQDRSHAWRAHAGGERPWVRIGVHVGDVVHDGADILGDAVNIAARIEPLAPPGGICVSGAVHDQVIAHVPLAFEPIASPVLKGVHTPVDVFRVVRPGTETPLPAGPGNRIAVLPLASISPDPRDAYLADGLTDELIHALSQIAGLRVIARTSVDHYQGQAKPLPQIGRELNVRSVVEGSVRRAGPRLRVAVQLTDVASQAPIWTRQYDRELDDVFAIQSDIAFQVADTLRVSVAAGEAATLRARPTANTASYLAYLKGRTLLRTVSRASVTSAYAQFEEAIRLDPRNARAYAGLADATYARAQVTGGRLEELYRAAHVGKELIARSLEIDPGAAEAHASLGRLHLEDQEFAASERELRAAVAINPTLPIAHRWYARLLNEQGRLEEAVDELRVAEEADPLSPAVLAILARTLCALGRLDEGRAKMDRLAELEPDGMRWHNVRFDYAERVGDWPGLRREAEWFSVHDPTGTPALREAYWMGIYAADVGDREAAHRAIEVLRAGDRGVGADGFGWSADFVAEIHAVLGELEACFPLLEAALSSRSILWERWSLRAGLASARGDPRFASLLRRAGLF